MQILAKNDRGFRLIPVNCPTYPNNDVCCMSGSGGSICGSYLGSRELESKVHIIECSDNPDRDAQEGEEELQCPPRE